MNNKYIFIAPDVFYVSYKDRLKQTEVQFYIFPAVFVICKINTF